MFFPVVQAVVLSATCRVATDCYPLVWLLFGTVGHYIGDEDDYFSDYSPCSFQVCFAGCWAVEGLATQFHVLCRWEGDYWCSMKKKFVTSFSRSRRAGIIWRFSWPWCSSWTSGWWWSVKLFACSTRISRLPQTLLMNVTCFARYLSKMERLVTTLLYDWDSRRTTVISARQQTISSGMN